MKLSRLSLLALSVLAAPAFAAEPAPAAVPAALAAPAPARVRTSPHETIHANIDGNRVTVVYGRPYSKDPKTGEPRKIWGALVPFGKVWRTGSDEATLLVTQKDLDLGGTLLPAGAYTLWTLPAEDGSAKLIVSRQIGQWGTQYDAKNDFAAIALTRDTIDQSLGQFTMALGKNPAGTGGGVLKLAWETTQYSVAYSVKK